MAQTVVHVNPAQFNLEETVSWAECVLAGDSRLRFTALADVQSSQAIGRTRPTRREKHARFVLEVQRVREREPRDRQDREQNLSVASLLSSFQCRAMRGFESTPWRRPQTRQPDSRVRIHRQSDAKCPANRATFARVLPSIRGHSRYAVSELL